MESGTTIGVNPVYAKIRDVLVPLREEEMHNEELFSKVQRGHGFEAVHKGVRTKSVQMVERNVYCGRYEVQLLLDKVDPYRVTDYGGGQVTVVASKEVGQGIQGHASSIHAVLICESRDLVISASYDLSIRVWNLKTEACIMTFRGHSDTICCLDLHEDRLVSGAKDCVIKAWNMSTGDCEEKLKFKHKYPIQCVKVDASLVVSSCSGGIVNVWAIEGASLLKVIDSHRGSVLCLFLDFYHILTGGFDGQVKTWSTVPDVNICLMSYAHPTRVVAVSLHFLRVITGCEDGLIRIFDFLSGDCLKQIKAGAPSRPILSMHAHGNSIVVNSVSSVILFQFAKVRWQYAVEQAVKREVRAAHQGSTTGILKKTMVKHPNSKAALRTDRETKKAALSTSGDAHSISVTGRQAAQASNRLPVRPASWSQGQGHSQSKHCFIQQPVSTPQRAFSTGMPEIPHTSRSSKSPLSHTARPNSVKEYRRISKWVMTNSERAVQVRVKRNAAERMRGWTTSSQQLLNKVQEGVVDMSIPSRKPTAPQKAQAAQDTTVRKPSSESSPAPHYVLRDMIKTYVPQHIEHMDSKVKHPFHYTPPQTARSYMERPTSRLNEKKRSHSSCSVQKVGRLTTTADGGRAPERMLMRATCKRPGHRVHFDIRTPEPAMHHERLDPFREHGTFRLLTNTQIEDYFRAHRPGSQQRPTQENGEKQRKMAWKMKMMGLPITDLTREDQVYAPELGDDIYI